MSGIRKSATADDVQWNGRTYRRDPSHRDLHRQRYYMATTAPRTYLHRDIYEASTGESIPTGWHVHHKDGNHSNNSASNLVAIDASTHAALHGLDRPTIDKTCCGCGGLFKAQFERAKWCQPACKERERRKAGTAYVRPRKPAEFASYSCAHCGTESRSTKAWAKFCGQHCRNSHNNALRVNHV